MKKTVFLIPSLLAAGFASPEALAKPEDWSSPGDELGPSLFEKFQLNHIYTLAAHRSHSSHRSHGSHRSSSGGGYTLPRVTPPVRSFTSPPVQAPMVPNTSRNRSSTPPTSVLPSPPAAALKTLPGNSQKFQQIVTQVQLALLAYGYYTGAIDGIIGPESKAALSKMQTDYGLKVTGTITPEVLDALRITAR
ncbi:His-Xaa-Ser repeat protein HxsA [Stappia sp.]|uniref:His-Xaa-Ser repeat protein HxsA n=1 Tax=Stappia sp. TaxID=1870903 RepID=UPI003D0FE4F6